MFFSWQSLSYFRLKFEQENEIFLCIFTARVLDRFSVARNFEEKENMRSNEARVTARDSFTSWQLVLFCGRRMTQKDTNQRKISGQNKVLWGLSGGLHGSVDSILASHLVALGSILSVPNFFRKILMLLRFIDKSAPLAVWTVQKNA